MKHRSFTKFYCLFILFLLLLPPLILSVPSKAGAHPLNNGYSTLTLEGKKLHYKLFIPEPDLLAYDTDKNGTLSQAELDSQKQQLAELLKQHIQLQNHGEDMTFSLVSMEKTDRELIPGIQFYLDFSSNRTVDSLNINYTLLFDDVDPLHLNFAAIINGDDMDQAVFDTLHRSYHFESLVKASPVTILWRYFLLGIEHILTGYDHLLFLLSLLLIAAGFSDILKIVTAFTVAHSITLFLAATGRVAYPSQWIEAAIAFTIAYVALENIWVTRVKWRWGLTFVFGLIHGLGFASALKEIGLPTDYFVSSLLTFNLGVEAGQLAVVLVLLPALLKLRKFGWYRKFTIGTSLVIFVLAIYWMLQRLGWIG